MNTATQVELPYYSHRPGSGPTIVLLHYWGGSSRTWGPVGEHLRDRALLTLDFRGWGRSRELPGPYGLARLAADTLAVVADAEVGDFVLVGHSMGAKVAQLVAATQPAGLQQLVLVAPAPARPARTVTEPYRRALSHAYDSDESAAESRDQVLTALPLPDRLRTQVVEDSRAGVPDALAEWPLRGIAEDITRHTRQIRVPALVVAGERDRVEPVDVLRENLVPYLASAEVVTIPGAGHLLPLEAPAHLAALLAG